MWCLIVSHTILQHTGRHLVKVDKRTENGTPFDSLRIKPGNLTVASARKRLQSQVRVLRF
jgi:hypothetical protein